MILQPAYAAADYLDEAVQALQSGDVYVSPLVGGIDLSTQQQLAAQADQTNTAVVILPAEAKSDIGGDTSQFIADIARRTGHDTVVVAFGKDLQAGSSVLPSGLASQLADQAETSNGSTGSALLDFVKEVRTAQPHSGSNPENTSSGGVYGIVFGIVLLVAAIAAGIAYYRSKHKPLPQLVPAEPTVEDGLTAELGRMASKAYEINDDPELRETALTAVRQTQQLFRVLSSEQPDKLDEKAGEFQLTIEGVNRVLDMYLKAQANPERVDGTDAKEIRAATRRVIDDFAASTKRNLSLTNVGDMIAFQVDVEMLTKKFDPQTETDPRDTP